VNIVDRLTGALTDGAVQAADRLARSQFVGRLVDVQLARVVTPLVASVLDEVLTRLEADPERIRALVRGQRETMVGEVVEHVRSGTSAGDARVERLVTRVLGRRGPRTGPE
jgi:hypothetical protein